MPKYISANEIYPGIWLGDIIAGSDHKFLKKNNITCIFNCTCSLPTFSSNDKWKLRHKFRVPVYDNLDKAQIYKMYKQLDKCAKLMAKLLPDHNILVHCHAGRQRSFSIVTAFLMKYGKLSKDDAIALIRTKRKVVGLPYVNFDAALSQYEKDLIKKKNDLTKSMVIV
jgi:protein-tyrosine phosphatase